MEDNFEIEFGTKVLDMPKGAGKPLNFLVFNDKLYLQCENIIIVIDELKKGSKT